MICAVYCVHDDYSFLAASLKSVEHFARHVFVSKFDWTGKEGDWRTTVELAKAAGATVEIGEWADETTHRRHALATVKGLGFTHALTIDSDEIPEPILLDHLSKIADSNIADRVYIRWDTYWKDVVHVVRPREPFWPCFMISLNEVEHVSIREYAGGRALFLDESFGIVHHMSYAGPDSRIWKKINTWSHRDEIVPNWWQTIWKAWEGNSLLRDLHPTHPQSYRFVEHIKLPGILKELGLQETASKVDQPKANPCSVVIPAYGQQELLNACIASLLLCDGLVKEIIVVDDCSPVELTVQDGVTLIRLPKNGGFANSCNVGFEKSSAQTVVFLNSDTVVPRLALAHLLATLESQGSVGAAGPFTNYSSHFQQIQPTYTSLDTLDLFALDFAAQGQEDLDVDMLVGFCLAVKRSVLEEVGLFDTRFGLGTFEDNDLSYRIRRGGYRLLISSKAFVHHEGSKSLLTRQEELNGLLGKNERLYLEKWQRDIESGFASTLSGLGRERIVFALERKPETRLAKAAKLSERADISLCMIVRDEENNIRACLESVKPFVREMLVLDTGSTDRTIEIARECGAVVREMEWPNSFSIARTESMKGAEGKWIMWVDADDTLPLASGETILNTVTSAPEDVLGLMVKVRFLESQGSATEVDHIKVFRNLPGLEWEGRIHEQIIGSLRSKSPDGQFAWTNAHVLHSGYDNTVEGQAKKKNRDNLLLKLDLMDRPRHPFALFNLGMTAHYLKRHRVACGWFRKCISVSSDSESHLRKAYALLVGSLRVLEKHDSAVAECRAGLARFPEDPELLFLMGQLMALAGKHEEAISYYQASLRGDNSGVFTSMDPAIRGWKALHNVALSHVAIGDWKSAKSAWLAALEGESRPEAAGPLLKFGMEHGDFEVVRHVLGWVTSREGESGMWPSLIGEICKEVGIDPTVLWSDALRRNPRNDEARRLMALFLLNSGREQEAVAHLDFLQNCGQSQAALLLAKLAANQNDMKLAERWRTRATELGWSPN